MQQGEIALHCLKLAVSGGAAFLAIMLWSRIKDGAWMSLIAGTILSYAGVVYDMLSSFHIIADDFLAVGGMSVLRLAFAALPGIFFIAAFIIQLSKTK
jgi:hypothetical protein